MVKKSTPGDLGVTAMPTDDGNVIFRFQLYNPIGKGAVEFILPPDGAVQVARKIQQAAQQAVARKAIVIPPKVRET